jgi:hypothetical protein
MITMKKYLSLLAIVPFLTACSFNVTAEISPPSENFESASLEILYSNEENPAMGMPIDFVSYTLKCSLNGISTGTHPNPEEACSHLKSNPEVYKNKIDEEQQICTMIYGGPQRAVITGEINGKEVSFKLDRRDGCAISVWDSWGPVLSIGSTDNYAGSN